MNTVKMVPEKQDGKLCLKYANCGDPCVWGKVIFWALEGRGYQSIPSI